MDTAAWPSGFLDPAPYAKLSACQIAAAVGTGELSAAEVIAAALERIAHEDGRIRAFTEVWPIRALQRARAVDRAVRSGKPLPLAGVPLAVKGTEGLRAVQTTRLLAAGCVPVGATSTPGRGTDWQTWGATERGPTLNPWNPRWSPGGSSAGSAAAVATGMVPMATGSDGAGSVRVPAAWCGVLGVKPTNGLLPARDRAGLNIAGPLTRNAQDAAAYLEAITGTTTLRQSPLPGAPLRVAWSATLGFAETDDRIARIAEKALDGLAADGIAERVDTSVRLRDPASCWQALRSATTEESPQRDDVRAENDHRLERFFAAADLLSTPTTPNPPHGHSGPGDAMSVALTWTFNLSGHPAVSIPAGFTGRGEPVGLQLVARHGQEALLLAVALAAEGRPPACQAPRTDARAASALTEVSGSYGR